MIATGSALLGVLSLLPWILAGLLILLAVVLASLPSRPVNRREHEVSTPVRSKSSKLVKEKHLEKSKAPKKKPATPPPRQESPPTIHPPTIHPHTQSSTKSPPRTLKDEKEGEAPTTIRAGDYVSFEVELEEGEEMLAELSASGKLNLYLMDDENLDKLDQGEDFWYEAGSEEVQNTKLKFKPEEGGTWLLVAENDGERDVTARIKINVDTPPHQIPLLKSEKIEMPDNRLDKGISL